jgi:hypothetical protein
MSNQGRRTDQQPERSRGYLPLTGRQVPTRTTADPYRRVDVHAEAYRSELIGILARLALLLKLTTSVRGESTVRALQGWTGDADARWGSEGRAGVWGGK